MTRWLSVGIAGIVVAISAFAGTTPLGRDAGGGTDDAR
jgi:hypothetical protein